MKKNIHPAYNEKAMVKCACGAHYTIASTSPVIEVEICSHCHPFYTGAKKIIDTAGRVEKFHARIKKAQEMKKEQASKKTLTKKKKR